MSKAATTKDLEELGQAWGEQLKKLRDEIGERFSSLKTENSQKSIGEPKMPIYKCRGKGCNFQTEDVADLVQHMIDENQAPIREQLAKVAKPAEPEAPSHRAHPATAYATANCPVCMARLTPELVAKGWRPPETERKEKRKETSFL